jgi:hypothetical protein
MRACETAGIDLRKERATMKGILIAALIAVSVIGAIPAAHALNTATSAPRTDVCSMHYPNADNAILCPQVDRSKFVARTADDGHISPPCAVGDIRRNKNKCGAVTDKSHTVIY